MTAALPIHAAAQELDVSTSTLRRWIAQGAPVAVKGRPGPGNVTLVDPVAVRAWQHECDGEAALQAFAGRVPGLLGEAIAQAFTLAADKRDGAWITCAAWQLGTAALLSELGVEGDDVAVPQPIARLNLLTK